MRFTGFLKAMFVSVLCFVMIGQGHAASNPLFTVSGVEVDVTAESALKARDQAFAQAQVEAFAELASRMLSERELKEFSPPSASTVSTMIKDFEITEEKRSSVQYIATYTFRFQDEAVKQYFSGSGIEFTDVASEMLLILPFYQRHDKLLLWSPFNLWMQAWNRMSDTGGLVPVAVPLGDLQDVQDISDEEALSYDAQKLQRLMDRYGTAEAVILIAVPDENMSLVSADEDQANGSLSVNIYRTDRNGPEYVQRLTTKAKHGQTRAEVFDQAVREVQKFLLKDWKAKTVVNANEYNTLNVRVVFNEFRQWAETERALKDVYGISEIKLQSLSPKEARLGLVFQGSDRRLRLALDQAHFTLSDPQVETYNVNGYAWGNSAAPTYDLYMDKYAPQTPSVNAPSTQQQYQQVPLQQPTQTPNHFDRRF